MADAYKYEPEGVANVATGINRLIHEYNDKIIELSNLVSEINTSSSWFDIDIKSAYINTCESYLTIYKKLITSMEKYLNYLNGKANSTDEMDNAYTRWNK